MANTNKEPNLVRAYLDKRDETRQPVWHVYPTRQLCTGLGCKLCKEARELHRLKGAPDGGGS